jgi:transposase-like protein
MDTPKTLQAAIKHYSDEQVCIDAVARLRWKNGPECPACGHREHYYLKTQKRWKCKECYKQFTVKLGTVFEDSPISLTKWLPALWMLCNCRNGISSYELHRALGVSQKAAWFMLQRLRLAMQDGSIEKLGGDGGEVEVDEAYTGGKVKNMHKSRKNRWQRRGARYGTLRLESQSGTGARLQSWRCLTAMHAKSEPQWFLTCAGRPCRTKS